MGKTLLLNFSLHLEELDLCVFLLERVFVEVFDDVVEEFPSLGQLEHDGDRRRGLEGPLVANDVRVALVPDQHQNVNFILRSIACSK